MDPDTFHTKPSILEQLWEGKICVKNVLIKSAVDSIIHIEGNTF